MEVLKLNDCYVIGTTLLCLKRVSFERLNKIKENLSAMGVNVDLSEKSIQSTVSEWRDFFELTEDGLELTKKATGNLPLVEFIFNGVLTDQERDCLRAAIFNYNQINYPINNKTKVIQFSKGKSRR